MASDFHGAPLTKGSHVKVVAREDHLVAFRRSVSGRVGVAASVFTPMGADRETVRVEFPPRRKGAKPLVEFMAPGDLEVVCDGRAPGRSPVTPSA